MRVPDNIGLLFGLIDMSISCLITSINKVHFYHFQVCPSANYYECKAMAIGARSQSARTYLEKHLDEFDCDLEPLVAHGLRALRDTLPNEVDLSNKVSKKVCK